MATYFGRGLEEWQRGAGLGLRELARKLGCSPSYLVKLYSDEEEPPPTPSSEFMAKAIAIAETPWKSVLRDARQKDQEAADAAAAMAVA